MSDDTNINNPFDIEIPHSDDNAKKRTVNLAMAAFEEQQQHAVKKNHKLSQGKSWWHRLIGRIHSNEGRPMLLQSQSKILFGSVATSFVAVVGLFLLQNFQSRVEYQALTPDGLVLESEVQALNDTATFDISTSRVEEVAIMSASPASRSRELKRQAGDIGWSHATAGDITGEGSVSNASQFYDAPVPEEKHYRDRFEHFKENAVVNTRENSVSTFSVDVDTAAYSFVRRQLNQGILPPKDAVRIEEMINYFDYQYPLPENKQQPFKPYISVAKSPWTAGNQIVHIGIQGYDITDNEQPDSNLVFLLDVSGSMSSPDKLPLVKQSMGLLLDTLKPTDTVSIVVYAGSAGAVLEPTPVKEKQTILSALERLNAGGSTAGAQGIQLAYQLAEANYKKDAVNRILLATDGDFNVGHTKDQTLKDFVERKREKGIYLSVLGFGQGNYQDAMMQTLAQSGNGIAAYIDTLSEAQKVLVHEATSSLFPIANDVKIQVEFNPVTVSEYRLIGYETRALAREDFKNDKVDAGDIGAGHTVTALYEITPANSNNALISESRYAKKEAGSSLSSELGFVKIRYKQPGEQKSQLIEKIITDDSRQSQHNVENQFALAVAGFAQLLRGSKYAGDFSYDDAIALASKTKGPDDYGYRTEFIQLVRKAKLAKAL